MFMYIIVGLYNTYFKLYCIDVVGIINDTFQMFVLFFSFFFLFLTPPTRCGEAVMKYSSCKYFSAIQ